MGSRRAASQRAIGKCAAPVIFRRVKRTAVLGVCGAHADVVALARAPARPSPGRRGPTATPGNPEAGRKIFQKFCARCHNFAANGTHREREGRRHGLRPRRAEAALLARRLGDRPGRGRPAGRVLPGTADASSRSTTSRPSSRSTPASRRPGQAHPSSSEAPSDRPARAGARRREALLAALPRGRSVCCRAVAKKAEDTAAARAGAEAAGHQSSGTAPLGAARGAIVLAALVVGRRRSRWSGGERRRRRRRLERDVRRWRRPAARSATCAPLPPKDGSNYHADSPTLDHEGQVEHRPRRRPAGTTARGSVWGFYRAPINPRTRSSHNLEHGGVVIWWGPKVPPRPSTSSRRSTARARTRCSARRTAGLGNKIALTAWTMDDPEPVLPRRRLRRGPHRDLPAFDEEAFKAFRDAFRDKGPEGIRRRTTRPGAGPRSRSSAAQLPETRRASRRRSPCCRPGATIFTLTVWPGLVRREHRCRARRRSSSACPRPRRSRRRPRSPPWRPGRSPSRSPT